MGFNLFLLTGVSEVGWVRSRTLAMVPTVRDPAGFPEDRSGSASPSAPGAER